ncbi:MAG: stealth family protein [Verrucomicrobia bacterium]|nr:stealth family protein [Verrucomicrobiota bacterium]
MPAAPPIDAVYTWVDGARPDYLELLRQHQVTPRDLNPERFRDPYEFLRHSLRSLEQHAPWVRHVYLFTCRPHAPAWLRRDHPRLRLVHHDEVVTEPGVLPTFNSNVIESFLHRLPGLSDHFLYFNDDYFLGAPLTRDRLYASDGRIRLPGTVAGESFRRRVYERQIVSLGLLEHGPLLILRDLWAAMQRDHPAEFAELRRHRFRQADDVRPDRFYRWYALRQARDQVVAEPAWRYLRYASFHKLKRDPARERAALDRLATRRPVFFCLNDDQGPTVHPEVATAVRHFLARLYPQPGSFEVDPA